MVRSPSEAITSTERSTMGFRGALLRTGMATTMAAAFAAMLLFVAATPSNAASSGYPPPTTSAVNTSCTASVVLAANGTLSYRVTCLFAPNAAVSLTVNGAAYGNGTADSTGVFTEVFVTSGDPEITVNGGAEVSAAYGATTTIVATGPNSSGGTNTATTLVSVPAPAATTASTGALAFTGADLAAAIVGGLALLSMGTLMVMYARRRAGRGSAAPRII